MKIFILRLILLVTILFPIQKICAQSNTDSLYNILSHLKHSADSTHFLYDFAFHAEGTDTFYHAICNDTNNTLMWRTLYNEMYYSEYTRGFIPHDTMLQKIIDSVGTYDTVAIGLMDFAFNTFKDSTLDSAFNASPRGGYFIFNNDSISDSPGRVRSPYLINFNHTPPDERQEIFAVAPLNPYMWYNILIYKIDPKFLFYGSSYNPNVQATDSLQIDFGEGTGWHNIDPTVVTYMFANYGYMGKYFIQARVVRHLDLSRIVIKYSKSTIYIGSSGAVRWPDHKIDSVGGVTAGIYNDCNNIDSVGKVLIYLSGIDLAETRYVPQIYREMIDNNRLNMLKDYGYSIVVVDWRNSKEDIELQASRVEHLINILKSLQKYSSRVKGEQFVLMAESMGGLIGRYALTEMEYNGLDHHTRLFVSYDSPQEGATIPLGLQFMYNWATNVYNTFVGNIKSSYILSHLFGDMNKMKNILSMKAVQQMLLVQDDYKFPSGRSYIYPENPIRTAFLNDLNNLNRSTNGWPAHCKLLAISDGLCDSNNHQVGFLNHVVAPLDAFLHITMDMYLKLFHKTEMHYFQLNPFEILASPNGTGNIININYVTFSWDFGRALKALFHIGHHSSSGWVAINHSASLNVAGVQPYDIMPGGCTNYFKYLPGAMDHSHYIFGTMGYIFKPDTSTGLLSASAYIGTQNLNIGGYSTMPAWCFIPRFSALAYNLDSVGGRMDNDIYNTSALHNMNRTNFDVFSCEPSNSYPNYGIPNGENFVHLSHFSVDKLGVPSHPDLTWMTREIGDINMNLDNMDINRLAMYQISDWIYRAN